AAPDFSRLDAASARRLGAVELVRQGTNVSVLGMADPWDGDRVRQASAALGGLPELLALPGAALEAWLGAAGSPASAAMASPASVVEGGPVVQFVDDAIRAA